MAFTDELEAQGVRISMDGCGRWLDNVFVERVLRRLKCEEVHLKAGACPRAGRRPDPWAMVSRRASASAQWFRFYDDSRPHQALGYKTPAVTWAAEVSPVDLPLR